MTRFVLVALASLAAVVSGARLNFNVLAQLKRDQATLQSSEAAQELAVETPGAPTSPAASGDATLRKQWLKLADNATLGEDVGRLRKAAKSLQAVAAHARSGASITLGNSNSTESSWEARVEDTSATVSRDSGDDDDGDDDDDSAADTSDDTLPRHAAETETGAASLSPGTVPPVAPEAKEEVEPLPFSAEPLDTVPALQPPADWRPAGKSERQPARAHAHSPWGQALGSSPASTAALPVPPAATDELDAKAAKAGRLAAEAQAEAVAERLAAEAAAEKAEKARAKAEAAEAGLRATGPQPAGFGQRASTARAIPSSSDVQPAAPHNASTLDAAYEVYKARQSIFRITRLQSAGFSQQGATATALKWPSPSDWQPAARAPVQGSASLADEGPTAKGLQVVPLADKGPTIVSHVTMGLHEAAPGEPRALSAAKVALAAKWRRLSASLGQASAEEDVDESTSDTDFDSGISEAGADSAATGGDDAFDLSNSETGDNSAATDDDAYDASTSATADESTGASPSGTDYDSSITEPTDDSDADYDDGQ